MKYLLLLGCAVVMACNNDTPTTTSEKDSTGTAGSVMVQADTAAAIVTPSCYAYQTSNNLIWLQLNTILPTATGHLTYAIMGKDKNEGTISGTMRGDTLFADYTFMSAGKRSVRQVAFLRRGNAFVEGYGGFEQKGDSMIFSKSDTLSFNGTMTLDEVPCTTP